MDFRKNNAQGKISIVVLGDADHASFDNISFFDENTIITAEDRGDGLHAQLNKLDSIWSFRLSDDDNHDRGNVRDARFVALGRDMASEQDSILLGTPGFQNEGDNEPTGTYVSNGDPSIRGMLGTERSLEGARVFFTQQHGLNRVFEVVRTDKDRDNDRDRDRDRD